MADDIFMEVNDKDKLQVLEVTKKNYCKHFLLHEYIIMMIKLKNNPHITQLLFCYGKLEEGVFLVETKFKILPEDLCMYFIYSLADDLVPMSKALTETNRIQWLSNSYIFEITLSRFTSVVRETFTAKKIQAVVQHYSLLWMPKETELLVRKPPLNSNMEYLSKQHAPIIAKNWPSFPGSEQFIEKEIMSVFGIGLFRKSDNKLLSSIMRYHSGGIYMLFSEPEIRRRGFGEFLLRNMAVQIHQQESVPFCTVFSDNHPSLSLVRKVGFQDVGVADYIFPSQFFQAML